MANLQILLIDDDPSVLRSLKFLLERCGYGISDFTDQEMGLHALRLDSSRFDLILIDYNMPGMSGIEVALEVRRIRKDLPVAISSGYIDEELRILANEAEVQELIQKPCSVDEWIATIERLVEAKCE